VDIRPLPGPKAVIYGEGGVHPVFLGSVYMKNDSESDEKAAWRYEEAMKSLGFEWLGAGKQE
jgi:hypothetical protein